MSELKQRRGAKEKTPEPQVSESKSPEKKRAKDPVDGVAAVRSSGRTWRSIASSLSFYLVSIIALVLRIWLLHHPAEVVFDEVHFGKFASYYLRGEYYFDVHPPLAKLLLAGIGWLVGYDGHFLFTKIGEDYVSNDVPYVAFRMWSALCGAGVIPISYLIMKEIGISIVGCTVAGLILAFDNALISQSRLILLDSMLWFSFLTSILFWIKFRKQRHHPFSFKWYFWLTMTGVGLACVTSVKMVGLFTITAAAIATFIDLWELSEMPRGLSMVAVGHHFRARFLCLAVVPAILYVIPFYIHFKILTKSGPGDNFMSLGFQETLIGNNQTANSVSVPFYSNVTFMSVDTSHYLHSHIHKIPLKHDDGKISSNGQQVNAYAYSDVNSIWVLEPVDEKRLVKVQVGKQQDLTSFESENKIRYVRDNDLFRLRHITTNSYLKTHDVAAPLTETNMEMTTITEEAIKSDTKMPNRYDETIWRLNIAELTKDKILQSKKQQIKITSALYSVGLYSDKKKILPEWGFKMLEVNGEKKLSKNSGLTWIIKDAHHEKIKQNVTDQELIKKSPKSGMPFILKFLELQLKMIHHNSKLVAEHPYASSPITWPFLIRGISFWENKDGFKQIYCLGNPFGWIFSIFGVLAFVCFWVADRLFLHRDIDDFGFSIRRWWDRALGWLFICWACNWIPYFLMGRMLFLHHYFPAYILSVILTCSFFDFTWRLPYDPPKRKGLKISDCLSGRLPTSYLVFAAVVITLTIASFVYWMPLTYGTGFPSVEVLRTRKLLKSWDLQYA